MKTCIVITTPTQISRANHTAAQLLELRTDLYKKFSLPKLVSQCTKPVIVTIKSSDKKLLQQALDLKVRYIDLDYKNKILLNYFYKLVGTEYYSVPTDTELIISYHNFKSTPSFQQLNRLVKQGVNKIAVMINQIEDNWIIAQLLQKYRGKITVIGMGELGIMTRLYPWQRMSYFALSVGGRDAINRVSTASAPEQLLFEQCHIKLYGIIGHPVGHSLSPQLHTTWFTQNNIQAMYQRWDTQNIKMMMNIVRFFNLAGASVTMPYKKDIKKYLDRIDPVAKKIGAVNTLVWRGKKLVGYNTDWLGVQQAFQLNSVGTGLDLSLRGKRVLILGRGGAARAVEYAAKQSGAKSVKMVSVRNRIIETDFDILINATPIRDKVLIPKEWLKNKIVMDCNYPTTRLLQTAKQMGAITIDGLPMLVGQAKEQFRLWTDHTP